NGSLNPGCEEAARRVPQKFPADLRLLLPWLSFARRSAYPQGLPASDPVFLQLLPRLPASPIPGVKFRRVWPRPPENRAAPPSFSSRSFPALVIYPLDILLCRGIRRHYTRDSR